MILPASLLTGVPYGRVVWEVGNYWALAILLLLAAIAVFVLAFLGTDSPESAGCEAAGGDAAPGNPAAIGSTDGIGLELPDGVPAAAHGPSCPLPVLQEES